MDSTGLGFRARPVISAPMQKRTSIRATVASDTDDWRHIQFIHRDAATVRSFATASHSSREWRAGFWYVENRGTRRDLVHLLAILISYPWALRERVNRLPSSAISGPLSFTLFLRFDSSRDARPFQTLPALKYTTLKTTCAGNNWLRTITSDQIR